MLPELSTQILQGTPLAFVDVLHVLAAPGSLVEPAGWAFDAWSGELVPRLGAALQAARPSAAATIRGRELLTRVMSNSFEETFA
jgi:hypothetical protein